MYTTKDFTVPSIGYIVSAIIKRAESGRYRISKKNITADDCQRAARDIAGLLSAHKAGRRIFLVLRKWPSGSWDRGAHYYDLYYISEFGQPVKVWPGSSEIATILGYKENNRDTSMSKWLFSSGAIGMDRCLAATESFCCFLTECTHPGDRNNFQFTSTDVL